MRLAPLKEGSTERNFGSKFSCVCVLLYSFQVEHNQKRFVELFFILKLSSSVK